jgi:hypothetical protein
MVSRGWLLATIEKVSGSQRLDTLNRIQSRTRATLRDMLLPKLLSGEMSIRK